MIKLLEVLTNLASLSGAGIIDTRARPPNENFEPRELGTKFFVDDERMSNPSPLASSGRLEANP